MTPTTTRPVSKTLLRIHLQLVDRWAVGGVEQPDSQVRSPMLVDPRSSTGGGYGAYLPMTGLAGSLAAHLGPEEAPTWLGRRPSGREDSTGPLELEASPLALLGATGLWGHPVHTRGVTAVDPARGAAAGGVLREEQWADPVGVIVAAVVDLPGGRGMKELMDRLVEWEPFVGRGRSTGQGRAMVTGVEGLTVQLDNEAQLTWWLTERDSWLRGADPAPSWAVVESRTPSTTLIDHRLDRDAHRTLTFEWIVDEPIHVGIGKADGDVRKIAAAQPMRSQGRAVIPGSSWKGVFRHRIESILAVAGADTKTIVRLLELLFGSNEVGRGLLWFHDSLASTDHEVSRTHIAIDRFTGGVRDAALFQIDAIARSQELTLRVVSPRPIPRPVANLVLHVAHDIADGLVGVGGNVSRGYGTLIPSAPLPTADPVDLAELTTLLKAAAEGARA